MGLPLSPQGFFHTNMLVILNAKFSCLGNCSMQTPMRAVLRCSGIWALSPYSTGNGVRVGYPTQMKSTQKSEMYMANARNLHLGPNATYIPLTGVGGWRRG